MLARNLAGATLGGGVDRNGERSECNDGLGEHFVDGKEKYRGGGDRPGFEFAEVRLLGDSEASAGE